MTDKPYKREYPHAGADASDITGPDGFSVFLASGAARVLERLNAQHAELDKLKSSLIDIKQVMPIYLHAEKMSAQHTALVAEREIVRTLQGHLALRDAEIERLRADLKLARANRNSIAENARRQGEGLRRAGELLATALHTMDWEDPLEDDVQQWRREYLREDGE